MKKRFIIFAFLPLLFGCTEFPTRLELIESDKIRVLEFIYDPAEVSPGDTVLLKAVFAGKDIVPENLSWSVSFDVVVNHYGVDTAFDVQPLQVIPDSYVFSERTNTIAFRFIVPQDMIRSSSSVLSDWLSVLPPEALSELPPEIRDLNKYQMIDIIEGLALTLESDPSVGELLAESSPEMISLLPAVLQILTVKGRIYAQIENGYRVRSDFSVRYNSSLSAIPGIPVNRNPVIDSVGVYKVRGSNRVSYDISEGKHQFIRLGESNGPDADIATIRVDTGYTYFIATFTSNFDSTLTLDGIAQGGIWRTEQHRAFWYYQFDEEEVERVAPGNYMNIINNGNGFELLYPPKDRRVENFTVWLEIRDKMMNEIFRPRGSALGEYYGKFTYTREYVNSLK